MHASSPYCELSAGSSLFHVLLHLLNQLLCEGLLNQEMLGELRREAILNDSLIDKQALDVLIR